jgi:protein gp37
MSEHTEISWTDHTFNPWWICAEVSPGCDHCYARTFARRLGWAWGHEAPRRFFAEKHWQAPLKWNAAAAKAGQRARVFCASMADVFESHPDLPPEREKLWPLIEQTPWLDWQLLTKRPHNIRKMLPAAWLNEPRPNVWFGTTVENQEAARKRIAWLLDVPAVVRFLSCEPLLGPLDLTPWLEVDGTPGIGWVICGGESGHGARPMHPDWARSLRDQCQAAGVAFHFKQWGNWLPICNAYESHTERTDGMDASDLVEEWHGHEIICMEANGGIPHWEHGKQWRVDYQPNLSGWYLANVGKKAAGRLLEGRTWDELPTPRPVSEREVARGRE